MVENMKIRQHGPAHAARVQQALFASGFSWYGTDQTVQFEHDYGVFADAEDMHLGWAGEDYFNRTDGHSATFARYELNTAGKLVPVSTPDSYMGISMDMASVDDLQPFEPEDTLIEHHPIESATPTFIRTKAGVNPKQGAGSMQLSPTLVSPLTIAHISLAKLNGWGKYGGANFIGTNVTMSTYLDAMQRHLDKIRMGEENDEVDNVSHWGAIGAGIDIILCARAAGTLDDDRLRSDGQLEAYKALTPMVKHLKELHKDKKPYHYLAVNKERDNGV